MSDSWFCSRARRARRGAIARVALGLLAALVWTGHAEAQPRDAARLDLSVEGLTVWQQRNDVRIPPQTGTEFSIVDLIGSAATPSVRTTVTVALNDRHQIRVVHAPLRVTGRGTSVGPIVFAGETFQPAPTDAELPRIELVPFSVNTPAPTYPPRIDWPCCR